MRLGAYKVELKEGTKVHELYGKSVVYERHRHRYEINPELINDYRNTAMNFTGFWNNLAETMEVEGHPFFMGTQFHPEFKSTPWNPSPPYVGLITACKKRKNI